MNIQKLAVFNVNKYINFATLDSTRPVASSNSVTLSLKDTGEATRRVTHQCCRKKHGMKLIAPHARPTGATGHKYLKTSSMEIA